MKFFEEKIARREYKCPKGEEARYIEEEPDYYYEVTRAYQYNVNHLPCCFNWCNNRAKCRNESKEQEIQ